MGELIAAPPDIASLNPVVFETDKDQVEAVIRDMCNKDHNVGMKHMHDDCVFVRPTGNPLNKDGWNNMMNNKDVVVESNDLVTIFNIKNSYTTISNCSNNATLSVTVLVATLSVTLLMVAVQCCQRNRTVRRTRPSVMRSW